jgi:cytochrome P450
MTTASSCTDATWWAYALPAFLGAETLCSNPALVLGALLAATVSATLLAWAVSPGGPAWAHGRSRLGAVPIKGPRGLPLFGSIFSLSHGLPHRALAAMARALGAKDLMAFSIGDTPAVVSSSPATAREVLAHPSFADRPVKKSARELMFTRAIGFAPNGEYWRGLRRVASTHLFAPRRVAAHEPGRQADVNTMVRAIADEQAASGAVVLRRHLQDAALNNIMGSVFGRRFDFASGADAAEAQQLKGLVHEGFELLGAFNWSDHLPWLAHLYDPSNVARRCAALVPHVQAFVRGVIDDHRRRCENSAAPADNADFVDVLLSLEGDEKLGDDDMVAVLWVTMVLFAFLSQPFPVRW